MAWLATNWAIDLSQLPENAQAEVTASAAPVRGLRREPRSS